MIVLRSETKVIQNPFASHQGKNRLLVYECPSCRSTQTKEMRAKTQLRDLTLRCAECNSTSTILDNVHKLKRQDTMWLSLHKPWIMWKTAPQDTMTVLEMGDNHIVNALFFAEKKWLESRILNNDEWSRHRKIKTLKENEAVMQSEKYWDSAFGSGPAASLWYEIKNRGLVNKYRARRRSYYRDVLQTLGGE